VRPPSREMAVWPVRGSINVRSGRSRPAFFRMRQSEPTIARLESTDGPVRGRPDTAAALIGALEKAGVKFIPENGGGGAGVRLRKKKR